MFELLRIVHQLFLAWNQMELNYLENLGKQTPVKDGKVYPTTFDKFFMGNLCNQTHHISL